MTALHQLVCESQRLLLSLVLIMTTTLALAQSPTTDVVNSNFGAPLEVRGDFSSPTCAVYVNGKPTTQPIFINLEANRTVASTVGANLSNPETVTFTFQDCGSNISRTQILFDVPKNNVAPNGRLKNSASGTDAARGVLIEIRNKDLNTVVNLNNGLQSNNFSAQWNGNSIPLDIGSSWNFRLVRDPETPLRAGRIQSTVPISFIYF